MDRYLIQDSQLTFENNSENWGCASLIDVVMVGLSISV
jgi:hypothetical protein